MFVAALFTIAKVRKQPNFPSTDKWIKTIWYTHTHADIKWNTTQLLKKWILVGGGVQDGEHMYTRGGFMSMYGKTIKIW